MLYIHLRPRSLLRQLYIILGRLIGFLFIINKEKKYVLIAPKDLSAGVCASIHDVGIAWPICAQLIMDFQNSLIAIKISHAKCRFGFDNALKSISSICLI